MKEVNVGKVSPILVKKQTLCDMFQISMTFLEDNFLDDDRMESIAYRKGPRFVRYEYEKAKQYMIEIFIEISEEAS